MAATGTMPRVGKKRETGKKPAPDKAVIYLEVPPILKELMDDLAREHNRRLTGECIQALQEYLARHQLWPPPSTTSAGPTK